MNSKLIVHEIIVLKSNFRISLIYLLPLILVQTSCKKLVEIDPPTSTITENAVYSTNASAIAVLTGLYARMNNAPFQGNQSISLLAGLSSDELTLFGGVTKQLHIAYYKNALTTIIAPAAGAEHWPLLYNYIYKSNAAIEGLNSSSANSLTPRIRQQLLGEAKFMRAFFYFYLVNLFGDVPLALTSDPKTNTLLNRTQKDEVFEQIITDLIEAQALLSIDYLNEALLETTAERVRPTKWAATALLARVYLYVGDWVKAEDQATAVINNSTFYSLLSLNNIFLKNSKEAIWQLQPTVNSFNTQEARTLIIPASGPTVGPNATNPVYVSNYLLNSFETNDQRAVLGNWINKITVAGKTYYFPYKYKINLSNTTINNTTGTKNMAEYFMVLRLGEQYLIRAEARAQQNKISEAQKDLNSIRNRAGLGDGAAVDKTSLLAAILHERQVELFSEWGNRWFDLKRTGNMEAVMSNVTPVKSGGNVWLSYQQLYPIPLDDLNIMPNLLQNTGY